MGNTLRHSLTMKAKFIYFTVRLYGASLSCLPKVDFLITLVINFYFTRGLADHIAKDPSVTTVMHASTHIVDQDFPFSAWKFFWRLWPMRGTILLGRISLRNADDGLFDLWAKCSRSICSETRVSFQDLVLFSTPTPAASVLCNIPAFVNVKDGPQLPCWGELAAKTRFRRLVLCAIRRGLIIS